VTFPGTANILSLVVVFCGLGTDESLLYGGRLIPFFLLPLYDSIDVSENDVPASSSAVRTAVLRHVLI